MAQSAHAAEMEQRIPSINRTVEEQVEEEQVEEEQVEEDQPAEKSI